MLEEPISDLHVLRPSEVERYCPSAISEYSEFVVWFITMNLICWPNFIPRQILEKDVFQLVGNLVSLLPNPLIPPSRLSEFCRSKDEKRNGKLISKITSTKKVSLLSEKFLYKGEDDSGHFIIKR